MTNVCGGVYGDRTVMQSGFGDRTVMKNMCMAILYDTTIGLNLLTIINVAC